MYDPDDLSRIIHEDAVTLKEKVFVKLSDLRILDYIRDMYSFSLKLHPPRVPHFPTSEMALDFSPSFPRLFVNGEIPEGA